jgi:hypothetical protein
MYAIENSISLAVCRFACALHGSAWRSDIAGLKPAGAEQRGIGKGCAKAIGGGLKGRIVNNLQCAQSRCARTFLLRKMGEFVAYQL